MLLANSFLERNSWVPGVVAAVVLFLIGTGITLYLRRRDKDSKHLDYQILSDTPIVTSRDRPQILKVMYGDTEVNNPFITEVRFKNTGKQVIEADDFLAPMAILRRNATVLDFNDVGQSEASLVEFIETSLNAPRENKPVVVRPNTLNPGDWFTIQVIYDSSEGQSVIVTGRIKGQTRPPSTYEEHEPTSVIYKAFLLFLVFLVVSSYATVFYMSHHDTSYYIGFLAPMWAVFGLGFGLLASSFRRYFRRRKWLRTSSPSG